MDGNAQTSTTSGPGVAVSATPDTVSNVAPGLSSNASQGVPSEAMVDTQSNASQGVSSEAMMDTRSNASPKVRPDGSSSVPPCVRMPVLWETLRYTLDPERYFAAAYRRYGDVFTMRLIGQRWVVIAHPDAVKEVFSHGPTKVNSGEPNDALRPVLGTRNLLLLDGDEHLHRRRMVLPPFHGERMRAYEELIRTAIRKDIASWPLGEPVAALPRMQTLAFSVIMSCVLGVQQDEHHGVLSDVLREMLAWVTDLRRVLFFFMLGPDRLERLRSFRRVLDRVDCEIYAEISRRRAMSDLEQREDILSLLICATDEDGAQLSDRELRDELVTLLVAGHETTATLISWAVHELARDQQSQDRLATEPGPFTDAVITETLRLRPPVGAVVRRLREPLSIAGYDLPVGTNVLPLTLIVHRRADLYPDPWKFDPTRFLESRPPAGGWFPFGGSVRRCIGASFAQFEAKIVLEELAAALRIRPVDPRPERTARRAIVLIPARGARVIAQRR